MQLAINEYTDLTAEEFRQTKLGLRPQNGTFRYDSKHWSFEPGIW